MLQGVLEDAIVKESAFIANYIASASRSIVILTCLV